MKHTICKLLTASCLLLSSGVGAQLITTVAGTGVAGTNSGGGPALMQQLLGPVGVSYDYTTSSLYIADSGAKVVRVVDMVTGLTSVFAGGGTTGLGDGKAATLAQLFVPTGVSADGAGNVYIADMGYPGCSCQRIRKVDGAGIITTVAGGGTSTADGVFATAALLNEPYNVKYASGNLYITDRGDDIVRRVDGLGVIKTVAGIRGNANYLMDGGPATAAEFNAPAGIAVDNTSGSTFISDRNNNVIRKITSSGIISTIAGNNYPGYLGDAPLVPATNAQFRSPSGIAYVPGVPAGTLYIADAGNNVIRKWDEFNKKMTLVAGDPTPVSGRGFANSPGAKFDNPMGICVSAGGAIYVADKGNHAIRKILLGTVTTIAGTGVAGNTGDGGAAAVATLDGPQGVAINAAGTKLYIADAGNNVIRVIDLTLNTINLVAGTYGSGTTDAGDGGDPLLASIPDPTNVTLDAAGNIYVTSTGGNRIRKIDITTNKINAYYGSGTNAYRAENVSALSSACGFNAPEGLAFNSTGDLLVAATGDNRIEWRINSSHGGLSLGYTYTCAGNGTKGYGGQGAFELLNHPTGTTFAGGNAYIADRMNQVIRKIDAKGVMSTIAGIAGNNTPGPVTTDPRYNTMSFPSAVAVMGGVAPALYYADAGNSIIRKVDLSASPYTETVYAGQAGFQGYVNTGSALTSQFNGISGIDVDQSTGTLYVTEKGNNAVRKVSATGSHAVTTVAGTPPIGGVLGGGGPATSAQMNNPYSVATDAAGNLYVADRSNNIIRKINTAGIITTFAGTGTAGFSGDSGPATSAQLSGPSGISIVDVPGPAMVMYIADQGNNRIRRVDQLGVIT
ncbi:MAG: hypothetical protein JWQ38_1342, partial [Flavipsychrobacter sp.]|nr:hypothetical protein [Flavipsychrobacter sp.]